MTKSCCTRPAGGGCALLTRRAGAAGFGSVRRAESPTAFGLRLRPSARATCHRHVARCGPGRGVEGVRLREGAGVSPAPFGLGLRAAGFWRYDEIPARTRPAGGGCALLTRRAGAGRDLAASGGRRALRPSACAFGRRPARRATGTSQGAGRGVVLFRSLWQAPCSGVGRVCGGGCVRAARSAAAGGRGASAGRGARGSSRGSSPILPHRESR